MNKNFIALTGGLASGKSTSLSIFKKYGFNVFSADKMVEELYLENTTVILFRRNKLERFISNNSIDKKLLRTEFFTNNKLKTKIEHLIHPLVLKKILDLKKFNNVIVEVPLLFEANLEKHFDLTICIFLDFKEELKRVSNKFKIKTDEAAKIISTQMTLDKKAIKSDIVIINNQSIEILEQKVIKAIYVLNNIPRPKRTL